MARRLIPSARIPRDTLLASLRGCLAWCDAPRLRPPDPERVFEALRSTSLAAAATRCYRPHDFRRFEERHRVLPFEGGLPTEEALDAFARERQRLLDAQDDAAFVTPTEAETELAREMAFVVIDWANTWADETSSQASARYVDAENLTPWDTWLASLATPAHDDVGPSRGILSWVPEWAAPLVDNAVVSMPQGCASWVTFRGSQAWIQGFGVPWGC